MAWYNSDGLYIKFGTEEGLVGNAGEHNLKGPHHMIEVNIDTMTGLLTTDAIQDDNIVVPKNARIERVDVIVTTAATSGGSAVLNVGLLRTDRSTNISSTGLVAGLALASINAAGKTNALYVGSTSVGTLVGTTLANSGLITASYTTAAFTAGAVKVRIFYVF